MASIIRNSNFCFFCGSPATAKHHLIFGTSQRKLADEDAIYIDICDFCHTIGPKTGRIHDNEMAEKLSKMLGQTIWEKRKIAENGYSEEEARKKFIKRYGKSYM